MMSVDTSLDAWSKVMDELPTRQKQVLRAITKHPDHTNNELSKILGIPLQSVTPRTGELLALNLIKRVEKRACAVTGGSSWTWSVV